MCERRKCGCAISGELNKCLFFFNSVLAGVSAAETCLRKVGQKQFFVQLFSDHTTVSTMTDYSINFWILAGETCWGSGWRGTLLNNINDELRDELIITNYCY